MELTNGDLSRVRIYLYNPKDAKHTLLDQNGSGKVLKTSFPDSTPFAAGGLSARHGGRSAGKSAISMWIFLGLPNKARGTGQQVAWSVSVSTLSTQNIA
jgi:hypothetical protein